MELVQHKPENRKAAGLMLASVVAFSLFPLVVALSDAGRNPFMFQFLHGTGVVLAVLAYLDASHRWLIRNRRVWASVWKLLHTRDGILAVVTLFDVALFAWSTGFIDTAIATIILESWIIVFVVVRKKHDDGSVVGRRYRKLLTRDYTLLMIAFVGLGLIILSQASDITGSGSVWQVVVGVCIAAGSAILSGMGVAFRFKVGDKLYADVSESAQLSQHYPVKAGSTALACQLIVIVVAVFYRWDRWSCGCCSLGGLVSEMLLLPSRALR